MTPLPYTQLYCHHRPIYHTQFPQLLTSDPSLGLCLYWGQRATVWTVCLKASLEGRGSVCRRNMLLKLLMVESTLVPGMCLCLYVYVYHCLLSPLVFYACCSLARQSPLRKKCHSGQCVSDPMGWKKRGWWQIVPDKGEKKAEYTEIDLDSLRTTKTMCLTKEERFYNLCSATSLNK